MIFITQLVYLVTGYEDVFEQFDAIALPTIARYNGRLLFRARPTEEAYLECAIEKPYEIHLVEFSTEADLKDFMEDKERKKFLHLKEQSIRASLLIKGTQL